MPPRPYNPEITTGMIRVKIYVQELSLGRWVARVHGSALSYTGRTRKEAIQLALNGESVDRGDLVPDEGGDEPLHRILDHARLNDSTVNALLRRGFPHAQIVAELAKEKAALFRRIVELEMMTPKGDFGKRVTPP